MSEWKSVAIADIAVTKGLVGGPFGSSLVSKDYRPAGVPVIRGVNLATEGRFNDSEFVFVSPEKVDRDLSRNLAMPGDVIFTQRGTLGQVGIVPSGRYDRYVVSQSQMRLRVNREVALPEFVYHYFRSPIAVASIKKHAIATGVPHINLGILASLQIPLPHLIVQRGICEVLEALDGKIAVDEAIVGRSHGLLQTLWKKSSFGVRDFIPVGELASVDKGLSYKGSGLGSGVPLINLGNFSTNGQFKSSALKYYDGAAKERHWVKRGDLVMANTDLTQRREILGRPALALTSAAESLFTHHVFAIRPHAAAQDDLLWLYAAFRDPNFRERAVTYATGTTVLALPRDAVLTYELPWPERAVRQDWNHKARALIDSAAALSSEIEGLSRLRDVLLSGLMSGAIRVRDAEKAVEDAI
ncbi:restriction endonuclease subunit S [Micromonospora sp. NPDC047527]|uniref:restriction endonuclease subunit S n=1 Tax=Micromonospora sp. NPDC047527 TaxID=3155144 RepID=UPI0033DE5B71